MYGKLIKNDIRKSKLITGTVAAFILISAMLISLVAILAANLFGAIDNMLAAAETPHFTRMHSGEVNTAEIEEFAKARSVIEEWQVSEYLNIDGAQIVIGSDKETLSWSTQDNGFVTQSEKFDFLLSLDGDVLTPADGEVYFPLYYMKKGSAKVGDTVTVHGAELTVAGFLRDSLMNPVISNSKRFLVSGNDFERLRAFGVMERLIEFRLSDPSAAAALDSEYVGAGMPSNGPQAITHSLVRMMFALEDGMIIAVLMLISILVLIVAFLCIRFTLLAKIEEDYREIGVLKAIGMRVSDIRRLYLAKYGVIAAAAAVLGFLLSLVVQIPFMSNIRLYLGVSGSPALGIVIGFLLAAAVFGIVMLYVLGVLKRFKKISAAQAVRFGAPQEKPKKVKARKAGKADKAAATQADADTGSMHSAKVKPIKGFGAMGKILSANAFLALKDVFSRKKLYLTMFLVVIISSFIMLVPQNISNTVSSPGFYTNLGVGLSDFSVYAASAQTDDVPGLAAEVTDRMSKDESVSKYAALTTVLFEIPGGGAIERIQVTLGDHGMFPISYEKGAAPETEDEIAISSIYASDLGKAVGDKLVLTVDGREKQLTVCGVYSDITNSGKTAKAKFAVSGGNILSCAVHAALKDTSGIKAKIAEYKTAFPDARVIGTEETAAQMFGDAASAIRSAAYVSIAVAALLVLLLTLLFFKMLAAKDKHNIAVLKSTGFTTRDVRTQYLISAAVVFILGVIIGTVLANTLGGFVGLALISSFGASSFKLSVAPLFSYLLAPLLLAACTFAAALLGSAGVRKVKIFENIKEA